MSIKKYLDLKSVIKNLYNYSADTADEKVNLSSALLCTAQGYIKNDVDGSSYSPNRPLNRLVWRCLVTLIKINKNHLKICFDYN